MSILIKDKKNIIYETYQTIRNRVQPNHLWWPTNIKEEGYIFKIHDFNINGIIDFTFAYTKHRLFNYALNERKIRIGIYKGNLYSLGNESNATKLIKDNNLLDYDPQEFFGFNDFVFPPYDTSSDEEDYPGATPYVSCRENISKSRSNF